MATINGTSGNDTRTGTESADVISGLGGNDTLTGLGGDDRLDGGAGFDRLVGGAGNDTLRGGLDVDTMEGGLGNDVYYTAEAGDRIVETAGGGIDTVFSWYSHTLSDHVENLTLEGVGAYEAGGNGLNNVIVGNGSANLLRGDAGNDTLDGGAGNDRLYAGTGADRLVAGIGNDSLYGGDGVDRVVFRGPRASYEIVSADKHLVVRDLNAADGDDGTDTLYGIERLVFGDMNLVVPEATDQWVAAYRGTTLSGRVTATGPDGTAGFTYALAEDGLPEHGTVTINADGTFTYTAPAGAVGVDHFTFRVTAPGGVTDTAVVNVMMNATVPADGLSGGTPVTVNTQTAGQQSIEGFSPVGGLAGGGSAVVWKSVDGDGTSGVERIMAQRFDAAGSRVGSNILVASDASGKELQDANLIPLQDGGFLVAWTEGVFSDRVGHVQRYDAEGRSVGTRIDIGPMTGWEVNTITGTALDGGGFVLTFGEREEDIMDLNAMIFDAGGQPVGPRLYLGVRHWDALGEVTALDGGGFALTWTASNYDGDLVDVFTRSFDAAGRPITGAVQVNTRTDGEQVAGDILRLDDGGFLVTWVDRGAEVLAQRYDAGGRPVGTEERLLSFESGSGGYQDALLLRDGSLLLTWKSWTNPVHDTPIETLYAQRMSMNGQAIGGPMVVDGEFFGGKTASAAVTPGGDIMFVWTESGAAGLDVAARHYDWAMV